MSFDDGAFVVCNNCLVKFRKHAVREDLEPLDDLRQATENPESAALYAELVRWATENRSAQEREEQR